MNERLNYYAKRLQQAFDKQQQEAKQQVVQKAEVGKVTSRTTKPDRLCKATIIKEMTTLIKQRKMK
ncbi:hypothetical protein LOY55_06580 [Pseudomonas sp. B21-040]|uniref:hypothetical protein n=1 Tax=Pseudomonas sp. B21-040 TaxID=2895486 RepID=UPI00215F3FAD|nr:hypothetical protein [Pseudomonas sp. B21-040]UVL41766.1 hypothetical protein LOY55_06580 [Pseudomonas sp. B21-040]